ncbi:MAG: glutamine-hydrolyzing carbamoyl-phosphate synthase small subunit [Bacteroidetes bacterium]|jgi:carbamoyl-phosphate synthase small subunit|nr:glutamine-hydrolyzing carbamoyl-phosphate synthase small subunit [Bacteroidota bacterium]
MKDQTYPDAKLVLADGTQIQGKSFGYPSSISGEIVFNTAMTGYPESLTDPSYKGQILVLTYPSIGNYGVPADLINDKLHLFFESEHIHISGLIIADYSEDYNHWNAVKSLGEWLREEKIPALFGVDTRSLTKLIREKGSMPAKIVHGSIDEIPFEDPNKRNLVDEVSTKEVIQYGSGKIKIALLDCGVKNNIIRSLLKFDTTILRIPWDYDFRKLDYDGLFISNGPGNPEKCEATIKHLQSALENEQPIFGICLGHQLLSLAAGAITYKLKFGHRSHNQPVLMRGTQKAYLTSQNHGYAVSEDSIPQKWESWFTNLNDHTNEGIRHQTKPFFSTQFHPEASSGPTDTAFLFNTFIQTIEQCKKQ